jgi:hypothetical protein
MMHLLDFSVKSEKVALDTYTVGYSWSVCHYLVPHSDLERLCDLTKSRELVDCPDCLLHILGKT